MFLYSYPKCTSKIRNCYYHRTGWPGSMNWQENCSTSCLRLSTLALQLAEYTAFLKSTSLGPLAVCISAPSCRAEWINLTTVTMFSVSIPLSTVNKLMDYNHGHFETSPCCQRRCSEPHAGGVEGGLVAGHGVLVAGDAHRLQDVLALAPGQRPGALLQVHVHDVAVRAARDDVVAKVDQARGYRLRVGNNLTKETG